jgi:hypothetical protein
MKVTVLKSVTMMIKRQMNNRHILRHSEVKRMEQKNDKKIIDLRNEHFHWTSFHKENDEQIFQLWKVL